MSTNKYCIMVEGRTDAPAYSDILSLRHEFGEHGFTIAFGDEVEVRGTSNKETAITFYRYLRRKRLLEAKFGNGLTVFAFFLDADADDLFGQTLVSKHVIYTPVYNIESVLICGDLHRALMQAGSLAPHEAQRICDRIGRNFAAECFRVWAPWIVWCIACKISGVSVGCNFGCADPGVLSSLRGECDRFRLADRWKKFRKAHAGGRISSQFRAAAKQRAQAMGDSGQYLRVINGKWLIRRLAVEIVHFKNQTEKVDGSIEAMIRISLLSTFISNQEVRNYYGERLRILLE